MYYMDYAEIGKRITERRKLHMTQAEVEDKADLSHKYLSNIEHGRSILSIDVLMQIAGVLHSAPNEFLLDSALTEEAEKSELDDVLFIDIRQLPDEKRIIVRNFTRRLGEQVSP